MTGYSGSDPTGKIWSLSAMFGGHLNLSVKKDESSSDTVTLHTSFNGSALDSSNLKKGQFSSYDWVTICTDQSAEYFDALFNGVVDPNWLMDSTNAQAAALRDLMQARRPVWRILHRVTATTPV
jgi:hypothetical protein